MGQDGEEAAELIATIRGEHVVMKEWFMGPSSAATALREKYGPYPGLWKEVLNWPGWRESRKAYLQHTQASEASASSEGQRKRRSRWGNAEENSSNNEGNNDHNNTNGNNESSGQNEPNKRRSRWGRDQPPPPAPAPAPTPVIRTPNPVIPAVPLPGLPGMPTNLAPQDQQKMATLQSRLRVINDKLNNLDAEAARVDALPRGHRERSPSPPPVYGADGKRKNTRAVRWRERFSAERQDILEELMSLNPATRKSGFFRRKRSNKIRIPVEEHPTYNFIGLIIGPRGKTQKELESKTGCKIAIRGRGSVKEGARGRRDGKMMEGDNEPLHVVITGDDQKSVDAATDMIQQMLVVIDDEKNVHKQQQLRELALLNGTLKEDEFCQICAEKGHRSFECPKRFSMNKQSVAVKCAICGDTSHPTRDCAQKVPGGEQKNPQELDSDYMSFMAELDGKKAEKAAGTPNASAPNPASATFPPQPPRSAPGMGLPPPPSGTGLPGLPSPAGVPPPPLAGSGVPPQVAPAASGGSYSPSGGQSGQSGYYGNQQPNQQFQQRQQYGHYGRGGGGQPYHQAQGHVGASYQQQGYGQQPPYQQQQQQQQQPHQARPGEEMSGWDPRSYYGNGGADAGGFNWWS